MIPSPGNNRGVRWPAPAWSARVPLGLFGAVVGITATSCRKDEPVDVVPAAAYARAEAPPIYAAPPSGEPETLRFSDITRDAGIEFTHVTGAFGEKWMPETMGGGAAFFDYDNDGRPDILLVNSSYWPDHAEPGPPPTSKLYRNLGNGRFEDMTEASGLGALSCYGMGTSIADYDGDGDEDIYVTAVGKNHLLRNDAGRLVDVTDHAGVGFSAGNGESSPWEWSSGAAWLDYDRDGDIDLFVANYVRWTPDSDIWTTLDGKNKTYATPQPYDGATCVLFRNEGGGRFADATKQAGVFNPRGKSMAIVADDFNDDGWPDLFVTNDTQPNFLYMNNSDGTFTDRALSAGVGYDENGLARAGMGVSVADVEGRGARSIAIGNFSGEPLSLYTQVGVDTYIDRAGASRISNPTNTMLTFGVLFADFNLDGYDDLMLANGHIEPDIETVREGWTFAQPTQLFLNNRNGTLVEITEKVGPPLTTRIVGRALATADIDADGDLDVLIACNGGSPKLLRNDLAGDARVVRVTLEGPSGNRAAIGSRLRAVAGDLTITRYISTGGSYLSQSEMTATFGLGDAEKIDRLVVRWPDGSEDSFESLSANHFYTIRAGNGIVDKHPIPR